MAPLLVQRSCRAFTSMCQHPDEEPSRMSPLTVRLTPILADAVLINTSLPRARIRFCIWVSSLRNTLVCIPWWEGHIRRLAACTGPPLLGLHALARYPTEQNPQPAATSLYRIFSAPVHKNLLIKKYTGLRLYKGL